MLDIRDGQDQQKLERQDDRGSSLHRIVIATPATTKRAPPRSCLREGALHHGRRRQAGIDRHHIISADGTYVVSGTLADGQVVVNLPGDDDKAQIVLDGVTIHNEDGPAIQIDQADKVFLTFCRGARPTCFPDGASYALAEGESRTTPRCTTWTT